MKKSYSAAGLNPHAKPYIPESIVRIEKLAPISKPRKEIWVNIVNWQYWPSLVYTTRVSK